MASKDEASERRDLIVLVADLTMRMAIHAVLARHRALGIRALDYQVVPHPEHDPGVYHRSPDFLRPFRSAFDHALVMCDKEGSGRLEDSSSAMVHDLERRLADDWGGKCAAVVLDPELEMWLWSDSPEVEQVLGWQGRDPDLRSWLIDRDLLGESEVKPARPKEAVEEALKAVRKPRSAALYGRLASRVGLRRCEDAGFQRFRSILQNWFAASS